MVQELNHKDPSWLNTLLLVAIFIALSLALVLAYKGWKEGTPEYELSRLKIRARYYGGISPGTIRSYFNAYGSTYGSVEGAKTRADGLAKNPRTNYQAMFRNGSHHACFASRQGIYGT